MTILGMDYGTKRIGIAVSDPMKLMAHPVGVFSAVNRDSFLNQLKQILQEKEVREMVVGIPTNLNGSQGTKAKEVIDFVGWLKPHLDLPIHLWDERFTTLEGTKLLIQQDVSRKRRRQVVDALAAQLLLQGYLDRNRIANKEEIP